MTEDNNKLSREELNSLRLIAKRVVLQPIPHKHEKRLVELGLARQLLGGVGVTDRGKLLLRKERLM